MKGIKMSEQSEMMDRVERLARELGRVERELEAAKNYMQEGLTASKTDFDPEIVRRLGKIIECNCGSSGESGVIFSPCGDDSVTWGDLRKLYDALK